MRRLPIRTLQPICQPIEEGRFSYSANAVIAEYVSPRPVQILGGPSARSQEFDISTMVRDRSVKCFLLSHAVCKDILRAAACDFWRKEIADAHFRPPPQPLSRRQPFLELADDRDKGFIVLAEGQRQGSTAGRGYFPYRMRRVGVGTTLSPTLVLRQA